MAKRVWGPGTCLDCREVARGFCDTCTVARYAAGIRDRNPDEWAAYQREYQRKARQHEIQGPRIREAARARAAKAQKRKKGETE